MSEQSDLERAIARAFERDKRITRRSFLRQSGRGAVVAGSALTLPSILAACGIAPSGSPAGTGGGAAATDAPGPLEWANWPLYIDLDDDGNICAITVEHASRRADLSAVDYEQVAA